MFIKFPFLSEPTATENMNGHIFLFTALFFVMKKTLCVNLNIGKQKYKLSASKIKNELLNFYNSINILDSDKYFKDSIKKVNLSTKIRKRLYKDNLSVYANVSIKEKKEDALVPIQTPVSVSAGTDKKGNTEKWEKEEAEKNKKLDEDFKRNFILFSKNNFFCIDELGFDMNLPLLKNSNLGANIIYKHPKSVFVNAYANAYNSVIKGEFNTADILKRISFFQFYDNFYLNANYDFKNKKALLNVESKVYEYYNRYGDNISFNNKLILQRDRKNQYDGSVCLSLKYNNNVFTPVFNFKDKSYEYNYDNINPNRKFSVKIDKNRNVHFNYFSLDKINENNKYFLFFNFIFSNPMQSVITLKREYIF